MPKVAAQVVAGVLRGIGGPGWSVAPMVGASWSPTTGISTAAGVEVGKTLGGNSEAFGVGRTEAFVQGWRDNGSGAVSAMAGLRWRF